MFVCIYLSSYSSVLSRNDFNILIEFYDLNLRDEMKPIHIYLVEFFKYVFDEIEFTTFKIYENTSLYITYTYM